MAYTMAHYNALKEALATGAKSVYYGDKRVDYRTISEMKELLRNMEDELGIRRTTSRFMKTHYSKGIK